MLVIRLSRLFGLPAAVLIATLTTPAPSRSEQVEPSVDFKNGLVAGQTIEAMQTSLTCLAVLSMMEDTDDENNPPEDAKALLLNRLLGSALVLNHAIEHPNTVMRRRIRCRKYLTSISDYLHEHHPIIMDASEYETRRDEFTESLQGLKSDKIRQQLQASYDGHVETVKILAKYRSTPEDTGRASNSLE